MKLLPLYTTDEGGSVLVSSDTWPNVGGVLGLTRAQIAEARAAAVKPPGGGGFAYMAGPDNALVEYAGNYPAERFNHVHLWQEEPLCALIWYQKHLNAPVRAGFGPAPSEADCKVPRGEDRTWPALNREGMFRTPRAGVEFGDVVLTWYANQGETPLVSPRGQLQDHIALSVADLDAWMAKLRGEGCRGAGGAVSARCDARGDDRGAEQGGVGVGRGAIASPTIQVWTSGWRNPEATLRSNVAMNSQPARARRAHGASANEPCPAFSAIIAMNTSCSFSTISSATCRMRSMAAAMFVSPRR